MWRDFAGADWLHFFLKWNDMISAFTFHLVRYIANNQWIYGESKDSGLPFTLSFHLLDVPFTKLHSLEHV